MRDDGIKAIAISDAIIQGCTTCGPRAACGPRKARMRPAASSQNVSILALKCLSCIGNATATVVCFIYARLLDGSSCWNRKVLRHCGALKFSLGGFQQYFIKKLHIHAKIYGCISEMSSASGGLRPPDPLTRGVAPGPHWGHSPQTPVVALRFGSTFPSGPPLQISCAPLFYVNQKCHGVTHHHQRERINRLRIC